MRRDLTISNGRTLNAYLPREAAAILGPLGVRCGIRIQPPEADGTRHCRIELGGRFSLATHSSPIRPLRICFSAVGIESPITPSELGQFGPTNVSWSSPGAGVLEFVLPAEMEQPRASYKRRRRVVAVTAAPAPVAPELTYHERLRLALAELNAIITSGQVDDVDLFNDVGTIGLSPIRGRRLEQF